MFAQIKSFLLIEKNQKTNTLRICAVGGSWVLGCSLLTTDGLIAQEFFLCILFKKIYMGAPEWLNQLGVRQLV